MKNEKNRKNLLLRLLPEVFQKAKILFCLNYVVAILDGILSACSILYLQKVLDKIMSVVNANGNLRECRTVIGVFLLIQIGNKLTSGIYNIIGEVHAEITAGNLGSKINRKLGRMEPVCFEETATYNEMKKAYSGAASGRNFVNTYLTLFFLYGSYYAVLFVFLYRYSPALLFLFGGVFLPGILTEFFKIKTYRTLEEKTAVQERKMKYYGECVTAKEAFMETRLTGAFPYFRKLLGESIRNLNAARKIAYKENVKWDIINDSYSLLAYLGNLALLFYLMLSGQISPGVFGALFCSIDSMYEMANDVIKESVKYGVELRGKIENYLKFGSLPEKKQGEILLREHLPGKEEDIILEHVDFSYPGSGEKALTDVSLKIGAGETVAIVGANGAGKTTLARIIAGIYLPDKGVVKYGGFDTTEVKRDSLYQKISGVFQRFGRYKLSLRDNVTISRQFETEKDENVKAALAANSVNSEDGRFSAGLDTILANEFGGMELSGGQWQRVAMARGFYREHEVLLLDEPTAAIDPLEEKRVLEGLADMARDKTAVVITHRLAFVRRADKVVLMDKGRIAAWGTHEELLEGSELYRNIWDSQARQYV